MTPNDLADLGRIDHRRRVADVRAWSDAASNASTQIAHALHANAVVLDNLMCTHLDHAAVGDRV